MNLENRLKRLEVNFTSKVPGCNPTLFIVIPKGSQDQAFVSDTYRPTEGEIEKYLKSLKDSGQCRDCKGSCAVDWAPGGFTNHTLYGECNSSSSGPKVSTMICADAEIPVLTRRLMNGGRLEQEK